MCHLCSDLDAKLERYFKLVSQVTDRLALEALKKLIAEVQSKKSLLHPEPNK